MHSIVEYFPAHEGYKCGYCKSPNTNYSHGMWAHSMTVSDYQDLIDRGWRRSGKYCYKPTMEVTCCPMYTIRCRVEEFKASKSQKKVLKRFNKIMMAQVETPSCDAARKMSTCSSETEVEEGRDLFVEPDRAPQHLDLDNIVNNCSENVNIGEKDFKAAGDPSAPLVTQKEIDSAVKLAKPNDVKRGAGPDPSRAPCKKAKQLRWERKLDKLKGKGVDISNLSTNKNFEKQVEDFINEMPKEAAQRLQIKLVRTNPPSPEYLATATETYQVYVKYQMGIHDSKIEKCGQSSFIDFLVKSPLLEEHSDTGPVCGYGSFHQQYWLDGKLIAIGVIDILPKCVSSVYFFYNPEYMNLTLGTYGALREISFTRQLSAQCPELKYYYMGYYIHSCPKMRYKGNFHPSDLLCPETYNWFPISECIPKLEISPYSRLDPDIDNVDTNSPKEKDIKYVPVLFRGSVVLFDVYRRKYPSTVEVFEYATLVGLKTAKSMFLVRG